MSKTKQIKSYGHNWTPLGKPLYILTVIFCVVECLLAVFLFYNAVSVFTSTSENVNNQQKVAAVIGAVIGLVILIFGIIATAFICKHTKVGAHVNMGLACCSIFFFNPVVGILAVVYSAQTTK